MKPLKGRVAVAFAAGLSAALPAWSLAGAADVPDFGPNVLIFDPAMTNTQSRLDALFSQQERSQLGTNRYALLFRPGRYDLDVQVGFYTQVLGLGASPDDVAITGAVRCKARWMANSNATCSFWRCVENLSVTPTQDSNINIWAVSQATALRRVHVKGDLNLWDGGWSIGGFLADCQIDGQVNSGSQQQWFSRNAAWGRWKGASWNMVFVGISNPPAGRWLDPAEQLQERPRPDPGHRELHPTKPTKTRSPSFGANPGKSRPL
jgi:hypothetical protein